MSSAALAKLIQQVLDIQVCPDHWAHEHPPCKARKAEVESGSKARRGQRNGLGIKTRDACKARAERAEREGRPAEEWWALWDELGAAVAEVSAATEERKIIRLNEVLKEYYNARSAEITTRTRPPVMSYSFYSCCSPSRS